MIDNKGLKYMLDQPNLNARKSRWLDFLSEYDFEIQHIKGKENKVVDALSKNEKLNFAVAINTYKTPRRRNKTRSKLSEITSKCKRKFNSKFKNRV